MEQKIKSNQTVLNSLYEEYLINGGFKTIFKSK